jgi:hypothetical protein
MAPKLTTVIRRPVRPRVLNTGLDPGEEEEGWEAHKSGIEAVPTATVAAPAIPSFKKVRRCTKGLSGELFMVPPVHFFGKYVGSILNQSGNKSINN